VRADCAGRLFTLPNGRLLFDGSFSSGRLTSTAYSAALESWKRRFKPVVTAKRLPIVSGRSLFMSARLP